MREFAGIDLGRERAPDETTVCKFRHLAFCHQSVFLPMQFLGRFPVGDCSSVFVLNTVTVLSGVNQGILCSVHTLASIFFPLPISLHSLQQEYRLQQIRHPPDNDQH